MTPPRPFMLQREGFNRIAYAGDYMPTYPNGGIGVQVFDFSFVHKAAR